jgi:hypothetical protein
MTTLASNAVHSDMRRPKARPERPKGLIVNGLENCDGTHVRKLEKELFILYLINPQRTGKSLSTRRLDFEVLILQDLDARSMNAMFHVLARSYRGNFLGDKLIQK